MVEYKIDKIKKQINSLNEHERTKDYVINHFEQFGFSSRKAAKWFCCNHLQTE